MQRKSLAIDGAELLTPKVFQDERGFFLESFRKSFFEIEFVQDNHSRSKQGVLRGLHYQINEPQGKLVRAARGEIYDVLVDLRRSSPTFGKWAAAILSASNGAMLYVPPFCAHGFLTLSREADVLYKTTSYYSPENERVMLWSDPSLGIQWPLNKEPILSQKDANAPLLKDFKAFT